LRSAIRVTETATGHGVPVVLRIELSDGNLLDLSVEETEDLYSALWQLTRQRGAARAALKLRQVLTWPGSAGVRVAFDLNETAAVIAVRTGSDQVLRPAVND
jgi:hypothetical protein